jgi:hypothetical protein
MNRESGLFGLETLITRCFSKTPLQGLAGVQLTDPGSSSGLALILGASSGCAAEADMDCGGRTVVFDFQGPVEGIPYESVVSVADQDAFKTTFCAEVAKIEKWFIDQGWLTEPVAPRSALGSYAPQRIFELNDADFLVSISHAYSISSSLVPSSVGRRGVMQFPADEVPLGHSAILHELSHVYFPNGNRLLAEGFAVYLQNKIGSNAAFPDYKKDLHDAARQVACMLDSSKAPTVTAGLAMLSIVELDKIATPSPLQTSALVSDQTYPIAGSFVRFLIDTHGLDKFQTLFMMTPLKPLRRDGGTPDRWRPVYGMPLADLESAWKNMVGASPCQPSSAP